jgi:hypothetical protein
LWSKSAFLSRVVLRFRTLATLGVASFEGPASLCTASSEVAESVGLQEEQTPDLKVFGPQFSLPCFGSLCIHLNVTYPLTPTKLSQLNLKRVRKSPVLIFSMCHALRQLPYDLSEEAKL